MRSTASRAENSRKGAPGMAGKVGIVISNYNGYELPESGGEGAAPLYAVGIGLLALSAALLARSQRRRRGERA